MRSYGTCLSVAGLLHLTLNTSSMLSQMKEFHLFMVTVPLCTCTLSTFSHLFGMCQLSLFLGRGLVDRGVSMGLQKQTKDHELLLSCILGI